MFGESLMEVFDAREYYKRQVILRELGEEGQRRLKASKILIAGVGGLGSISALYLTLAGIGHIVLVDQDVVDMSNLHRQVLYDLDDLRIPKAEAAAKKLSKLNPEVKIEAISDNINEENVFDLVKYVDCVVDGLDNMRTRYLINRACVKYRIPYIFAGAIGFEGNLAVLVPHETACLECFLPGLDDSLLPTCETRGVIGATPGIIGTIQAMETIKLLAGINSGLKGKLLICDFITMDFVTVNLRRNPECRVCGGKVEVELEHKPSIVILCGSNTVNVNPSRPMKIDLKRAQQLLSSKYELLIKSSLAIALRYLDDVEVTIFSNGRMLIRNISDADRALKIYRDLISILSSM